VETAAVVMIYAPVPLDVARVADIERMQMLVESTSRQGLQAMLRALAAAARRAPAAGGAAKTRIASCAVAIDVDPLTI